MREFSPLLRKMLQARTGSDPLVSVTQDAAEFRFERLRAALSGLFDATESQWEQRSSARSSTPCAGCRGSSTGRPCRKPST